MLITNNSFNLKSDLLNELVENVFFVGKIKKILK